MGLGLKFSCTWPQCGGVKQYTLAHHQVQTCKEHRGVKQYTLAHHQAQTCTQYTRGSNSTFLLTTMRRPV